MRLATIGTNWITSTFIKSALKSKKLNLQAVYSRSLEKAKEFADLHSAPHYYNNLEEMAKRQDIDVVYIASPNSLHFEQAKMLLKHKKHVICEKPIFSNTNELKEAYQIANDHGVYLFEAVRHIYTPNFNQLVNKMPKIGNIRSANLHYIQYSSRYDAFLNGEVPNVFSAEYSGGALVDLGVYPLFLAIKLFGKPVKFSYHPTILQSGIDGNGTLILQYDNFVCTIMCSKISQSYIPSEIHGETGTIIMDSTTPTALEWVENKSKKRTSFDVEQDELDMIYEIETFTNIIQTKDQKAFVQLKQLSETVLSITEAARKQNNILFGGEL
ncbi:Gfo/Idh/MocA family protein [Heyndrickxia sp. NPDC080065]|uniref:Gfo/Idh/MocA family protein n=1 Tax=Heyndrickxia sp. NPDC080065 TaxID=3390568 RepID=UPI003D06E93C